MPYRRPDSSNWWISYVDASGQYVRRSAETTNHSEAKVLEQEARSQAWREKQMGIAPPRTFDDVMRHYLKYASHAHRSYESTVFRVQTLAKAFAGREIASITGQEIRNYAGSRLIDEAAKATVNRELAALSAAINYCRRELEWDLPNPVSGRKLREPDGRVRWLKKAEVESLCRAAREQRHGDLLEDFIRLAVNTGMRREEMLGLEWQRVDLHNRLIILEAENTKSARRRSIPLNMGAFQALSNRMAYRAERCPASPWVFARETGDRALTLRKGFEAACERAGIANFTIHDLRHTCAAWLVSAGVPLIEVRDLLGHAEISTTERYAHLAPNRVRAAVSVLDGLQQPGASIAKVAQLSLQFKNEAANGS